ncbi:MAG: hypothetical protein JF609_03935, partial [Verrucomicrobia bacterium]|nr:hypothetical protein [Verrucomicrobiota bacterium]
MNQGDDFKWLDEWAKKQGQHLRNLTIKDIFEIIAVLFAGAGLYYLIVQSHEMQMATKVSQGQLEIMKRQMDDAEAQQRGWLKFEWFSVKRITNAPAGLTSQYLVACEVKNYGGSAVLDIHPVFKTLPDEFTNAQQRMNGHFVEIRNNKNPPEPTPEEGGRSLMPQGSTTYTMLTAP